MLAPLYEKEQNKNKITKPKNPERKTKNRNLEPEKQFEIAWPVCFEL